MTSLLLLDPAMPDILTSSPRPLGVVGQQSPHKVLCTNCEDQLGLTAVSTMGRMEVGNGALWWLLIPISLIGGFHGFWGPAVLPELGIQCPSLTSPHEQRADADGQGGGGPGPVQVGLGEMPVVRIRTDRYRSVEITAYWVRVPRSSHENTAYPHPHERPLTFTSTRVRLGFVPFSLENILCL